MWDREGWWKEGRERNLDGQDLVARQTADIIESGHYTPDELIETIKNSSTEMLSAPLGIVSKDNQGYFCCFNTVPVLLDKQASEKDKGAFQKSGDAFQYSGILQTQESTET